MRKRRILRITVVFFAFLIVLTFFSRTIYRRMLPNVEVTSVTGGMLSYTHTAYDIRISGSHSVSIQIPVLLTRPLTISNIRVKPNQHISIDDTLVDFHAQDGEYLIQEAQRKLDLASSTFMLWQNEHENRITDLSATIRKTRKKDDKERLERELSLLEAGIMNATTKTQLQAEVTLWEETLAALNRLKEDHWQLKAEVSGYVERILAKQGDGYSGLSPLMTICPEDADYLIGCVWKDAPALRIGEWIVKGTIRNVSPLPAVDITAAENETILWFERADDTPTPDQISSIHLTADSPYYMMLAENKAFNGNKLYLLKSRTGAWGRVEYYAKEVRVDKGAKDDQYTAILSGVNYSDVLITSWNKPIQDGDVVLLASYE